MNYLKLIITLSLINFLQAYRLGLNRNYQYFSDFETIDLSQTTNYQSGVWFKYQPIIGIFQVGLISQSESNSSLLFYRTLNDEMFSLSFITINYDLKIIQLQTRIKSINKNLISNLTLDPTAFDGMWNYHYYYFKQTKDASQIIIGNLNSKNKQFQVFDDIQLKQKSTFQIIFGGGLNKQDDQFNEKYYLTYFLGIIEIEVGQNIITDPIVIFMSESYDDSSYLFSQTVVQDGRFDQNSFIQVDSNNIIQKNYKINLWVKIQNIQNDSEAYIFHISGILASDFKNKIGGNVAYLNYIENQLIFGYYSYDFPYFSSTNDIYQKQDMIDYKLTQQEWYMIAVQYYNDILYLYIANSASDRKYFNQWSDIHQFQSPMFYMYIGGDLLQKGTVSGQISLFVLQTDFSFDQLQKSYCHFSCLSCNGPYSTNCMTCLEASGREFIGGKCQCKFEYLEINQLYCKDFSQYKIIETQKDSNEILCEYGYFLYNKECFQCPSASQEYYIFCTECIINWRNWVDSATCTLTFQSNYDLEGTYLQSSFLEQFFTFNDGQLQLCNNCRPCFDPKFRTSCHLYKYQHLSEITYITCLFQSQYSQTNLECQQVKKLLYKSYNCQQYCGDCDNYDQCFYCDDPVKYYLTTDKKHCLECQIKFCKYCFQTNVQNQFDIQKSSLASDAGSYDFSPINEDMITYCALCYTGYTFNFKSGECEQKQLIDNCQQAYITKDEQFICLVSISNSFNNNEISITNCQLYMTNCLQCIHNKDQRLYCLKCISGYYVDTNIGICKSCFDYFDQNSVKECKLINYFFQDQWKIEIQPFYNSFFTGQQIYLSYASFRGYVNILECQNNYQLFDYECYETESSNTCYSAGFAEYLYYCQTCKRNEEQQSFSVDPNNLFECLTCPYQCKYCQPRSSTDVQLINPDFLSDNSLSNYCIKGFNEPKSILQGQISEKSIYFDPQYMFLTICSMYQKCQLTLKFMSDVYIQFYQIYLQVPSIYDSSLIKYMNMRKVTQLVGVFNYTGKNIQNLSLRLMYAFKTKVFSITKMTVHIIGEGSIFSFSDSQLDGVYELIFERTTVSIFLNVMYYPFFQMQCIIIMQFSIQTQVMVIA